LLLLFALRCLLPPGFMLDPQALRDGLVQVTLCNGADTSVVTVDSEGRIVDEQPAGKAEGKACPFASPRIAALVPDLDLPSLSFTWPALREPAPAQGPVVALAAPGPRLGPRAPPTFRPA